MASTETSTRLEELLGDEADAPAQARSARRSTRPSCTCPGPDFVDRVVASTDRIQQVLRNLQWLFDRGRLAGTGYVSILPVDQGIEHSGGRELRAQPDRTSTPRTSSALAIEGGCNAFASTFGVLGAVSRQATRTGSRSSSSSTTTSS